MNVDYSVNSGQTKRGEQDANSMTSAVSTKQVNSAGAASMGWTTSGSNREAHAVAVFAPAGGAGGVCAETCSDTAKNQDESDVDCGGTCGATCADGQDCLVDGDCLNGWCNGTTCVTPTCSDGVQNGTETDVDCGGSCPACSTCNDGIRNDGETDIDCGGPNCGPCADGQRCSDDSDCDSGICPSGVSWERWNDVSGILVSDIPLGQSPDVTGTYTDLQAPSHIADNFGVRARAYLYAPSTGNYVFWISSDDQSELWLSTDDQAANRVSIATVPGYTDPEEWGKYTEQKSAAVSLVAGERYYIEVQYKEGDQGDNMAVGWAKPGEGTGSPSEVVPGANLVPFADDTCQGGSATCSDGIQNQEETDIDCGGPNCGACADGKNCIDNSDCQSNDCSGGVCQSSGGNPCDGLCTGAVDMGGPSISVGNLGTTAEACHYSAVPISGGNCSNDGSRTLQVNGTTMSCDTGNWSSIPAARNGGHCIHITAGTPDYIGYATW
jgi:hypothetical protein